jgi:HEAT repeat protein
MAKITITTSPEQQSKAALLRTVKSSDIDEVMLSDCVGLFVEVDRAIARLQDTSSDILERLSHHSDKIVRQAVASHHNILPEDLVRLGKQFPDAFLSNPALDLILIENPGLLLNFDESLLVQIAKRKACPEIFLKWAMRQGSEQVLMAIAMNPSTPVELLQQLMASEFKPVKEAVRFHKKLLDGMEVSDIQAYFKQAVIERLSALSARDAYKMWRGKEISLVHFCYLSVGARLLIANDGEFDSTVNDPNAAAWMLAEIATDNDEYIRTDVARNPNTPIESLMTLAEDQNQLVRNGVASNPKTPEALLTLLSKDQNSYVRRGVASNPKTPEALLTLLSKDKKEWVRINVASNPNAPEALLTLLSKDKNERVRRDVASNPNTPEPILTLLSKDKNELVQRGVALNPNTPFELLMTLAEDCGDTNLEVLWGISTNPNTPIELVQKLLPVLSADLEINKGRNFHIESRNVPIELQQQLLSTLAKDRYIHSRLYAARNLNTPSCSLALLAEGKNREIRNAVARNPNAPEALLTLLSKDKVSYVRSSVASNPNAPEALLTLLSKDKNERVRRDVASNPNTPEPLLTLLSKHKNEYVRRDVASNPNTPEALLTLLSKDENRDIRNAVARNPNAPEALLTLLSKDKVSYVRSSVASNPNTPIELLMTLSLDEDAYVRREVASHPETTKTMLKRLAKDKSTKVRNCVAFNPKCPDELLIQLCHINNISTNAKALAIEKLNFPEDILALPHFNSILQTKVIPEKVLIRLGQHEDSEVRTAALSNLLHPSWIKSLIEAPKTNPLFIKWASKADQSAQSALKSDNVFFFAGKNANKAAVSTSELVRVFAMSDGASVMPARLAKSQKHNDWLVRMSIASNIGTPINALNKLKQDSHALVAKQAGMTIAKLSDKPEIELLDEEVRQSSFNELSKDIAVALKSKHHQTVAIDDPVWGFCINPAVLWDPSRINEVTEAWVDVEWQLFGEWILPLAPEALAPYLTSEAIEAFMVNHLRRKKKSLEYLASHILYSEVAFKLLAKNKDELMRERVASNPNAPEALLTLLSKHKNEYVRRDVASNPNTPEALLTRLSEDKDSYVRRGVASNPNTPEALLTRLLEDKDKWVRSGVASNPNTPVELLYLLANDNDEYYRTYVASNPNTPIESLMTLAEDMDEWVRKSVASNPNTPIESLMTLAEDMGERVRESVASNPNTPIESLMTLAEDMGERVRKSVASNPNTPEALLTILSKDKDSDVRIVVARNSNTPEALLKILSKDKYKWVRYFAVMHLDASKETFETSSTNKYVCLQSLSLAKYKEHIRIALSPEITLPTNITTLDIRRGVESLGLLKEATSHKKLTEMRVSKDRLQRVAVCFHHKVTENLLAILSEDKDLAVAEIAKEMLATFD